MTSSFNPGQHLVYVVDATQEQQEEITGLLSRANFPARGFTTGGALLDGIEQLWPACIITELQLPDMSALELTRALRSRDCLIPIIVLTSNDNVAQAVAALRSSVADYLTRPYVERDLIARLRQLLAPPPEQQH